MGWPWGVPPPVLGAKSAELTSVSSLPLRSIDLVLLGGGAPAVEPVGPSHVFEVPKPTRSTMAGLGAEAPVGPDAGAVSAAFWLARKTVPALPERFTPVLEAFGFCGSAA